MNCFKNSKQGLTPTKLPLASQSLHLGSKFGDLFLKFLAAGTIRLWRVCFHRYNITQTVGQLKYQFTPGKHVLLVASRSPFCTMDSYPRTCKRDHPTSTDNSMYQRRATRSVADVRLNLWGLALICCSSDRPSFAGSW
jgi:hypothetical protein